jgi:LAGLIDADG endonuclease
MKPSEQSAILNPWYVTGIVDGEGCFSISFNLRSSLNTGIEVRPSFAIGLNEKSLQTLKLLQNFFTCGSIRFSNADRVYKFEVRSISDLVKQVIPHFEKYTLQTSKRNDFELFVPICKMIHSNHHKNIVQLEQIIQLAYQMNPSGKRRSEKEGLLKVLNKVKV